MGSSKCFLKFRKITVIITIIILSYLHLCCWSRKCLCQYSINDPNSYPCLCCFDYFFFYLSSFYYNFRKYFPIMPWIFLLSLFLLFWSLSPFLFSDLSFIYLNFKSILSILHEWFSQLSLSLLFRLLLLCTFFL